MEKSLKFTLFSIMLLLLNSNNVFAGKIFDSNYYINQKNQALTEKVKEETKTEKAKSIMYYSLAGGVILYGIHKIINSLKNNK